MKIIKAVYGLMLPILLLGLHSQCQKQSSIESPDQHTEDSEAPKQKYLVEGVDHGLLQSPINIITKSTRDTVEHKVLLHYGKSNEDVVNLGHTIQVNYDSGNTLSFDNRVYAFKQFHFHTPSEHLVDGITYPMEMHMVHTHQGSEGNNIPEYLVVGILFKVGAKNAFLESFMEAVPLDEGVENMVQDRKVDINDLFAQSDQLSYYTYKGSLTTPPYTESVTWLMIKHVFEASTEQIKFFNELEGNNARHVQALYGRKVDG